MPAVLTAHLAQATNHDPRLLRILGVHRVTGPTDGARMTEAQAAEQSTYRLLED